MEERDHCLRTALSQSDRVGRLAQDLLELARLELGAVRPVIERFSIVELTLDVVQKLALAAQARGQRLLPSFPPALPDVAADIGMISHIFSRRGGDAPLPAHGGGLGLLIVRQIMRLHGDDLVLEDRPGAGTVLAFSLRRDR